MEAITPEVTAFLVGGVVTALYIASAVYYVLLVIAQWKIFTKAGEKGWKSLIPVYNGVVQYRLTWKPIMVLPVALLLGFFAISLSFPGSTVLVLLGAIAGIAGFVFYVIGLNKLSKSFGKGTGFTVGLVLLGFIFYLILGFGKAQYIGNTTTMDKAAE